MQEFDIAQNELAESANRVVDRAFCETGRRELSPGSSCSSPEFRHRIDFVPVRLRDCQILNLQMNTMVGGTTLRGMFEDRIQNVIREIKERPNLIPFIDEIKKMIGPRRAKSHRWCDGAQRIQGRHPGG